ncbi:hypothetical protein [Microbulbifer sp. S227A]|uniref:hypothetical protein n=1 Tax=Microbulbifer sp. S227A TaxID=3415131 RepID=UPI003C7BCE76
MDRIVVHAGFHKTGTTTVQATLRANGRVLKPHLRVILRQQMPELCDAARDWSVSRRDEDMARFCDHAVTLARGWDTADPRPVLLCSEDLAGRMPGRRNLCSYDATPSLMRGLVASLARTHPDADIRLFFSTRAAAPWLASCHAQHLRAVRMTMDCWTYAETYRASANLVQIVDSVQSQVAPHPVSHSALETSAGLRLGPLEPVLDLCDLPAELRGRIEPQHPANTRHDPETLQALLRANRKFSDSEARQNAKRAILDAAKRRNAD